MSLSSVERSPLSPVAATGTIAADSSRGTRGRGAAIARRKHTRRHAGTVVCAPVSE